MKSFGNKKFIEAAIEKVKYPDKSVSLREIDGLIALAVFSQSTKDGCYFYKDSLSPFAMIMDSHRTSNLFTDMIEIDNPLGVGFILMNAEKVPHFTTKIDDALRLFDNQTRWSVSFTGLVKCEHAFGKFRDRLRTPQLGICSVGLQLQRSLWFAADFSKLDVNQVASEIQPRGCFKSASESISVPDSMISLSAKISTS